MKLFNLLWYRWKLWRFKMDMGYTAPLWRDVRDGWIYPDGTFVKRRTDYT